MKNGSRDGGCCQPGFPPAPTRSCPTCRTPGQPVGLLTVKALLRETAMRRLAIDDYLFCATGACPTVYFGERAGLGFTRSDLRVGVWHKETPGARMICYCFDENEAAIRSEIELHGRSRAVERVRIHISAQRCACELRNPRGACCLGDLKMAIRDQEMHLGTTAGRRES